MAEHAQMRWAGDAGQSAGNAPHSNSHAPFGNRNRHKPLKAAIGIALLIALSVLFYLFHIQL
jgi:hypothetical protein